MAHTIPTSLSIDDALSLGARTLHGIEDGQVVVVALLGAVTGWPRTRILAGSTQTLTVEQQGRFEALLRRAARHEPLAYLLGEREFYGLTFTVTPEVLIPRPASETLVDLVLEHAKTWPPELPYTVVDVGTGSGCIAIAIAKHVPEATVYAIDISESALTVARGNATQHNVHNVTFIQGSLLEPLTGLLSSPIAAIAANLPYVSDAEYTALSPNVLGFEPELALKSGADPDTLNHQLVEQAGAWVGKGSLLAYETTNGRVERVR